MPAASGNAIIFFIQGDDILVKEIVLNETAIQLDSYREEIVNGLHKISITFPVTHEDYHDVTTLLYKGNFDVKVPENNLSFKASIQQYFTDVTNLYEKGQIGQFQLTLLEVKEGNMSCG